LHRRPQALAALAGVAVKPVMGDVTDLASLNSAVKGCAAVFHVAASTNMWKRNNAAQWTTNVEGTQNVIKSALDAGVKRFIHTSSVAVFGLSEVMLNEQSPLLARDSWISYARSKTAADDAVMAAVGQGLPALIMNPTHLMGPGDTHSWARLIRLIDQQKLPGLPPGAGSFADGRAVARAHVAALSKGQVGERYLLGGTQASFVELAQLVAQQLGRPLPSRVMPAAVLKVYAKSLEWISYLTGKEPEMTPEGAALTSHKMTCDIAKAQRELGLHVTPMAQLVSETLAWMRAENMLLGTR
jgi:dihydroflavonol-4-reductase